MFGRVMRGFPTDQTQIDTDNIQMIFKKNLCPSVKICGGFGFFASRRGTENAEFGVWSVESR